MALNEGKITQAGLRLLAKVSAGAKLELTKFAVGDGDLGSRDPLTLTDLVRRLYDYTITRLASNNNVTTVTFNFSNQVVGTGFYWREVGLWARDPDVGEILFMYANSGSSAAEYIPPGGSSTILERQFNWRLVGSNAASITANIDQSLMYASQDDLAALAKQSLQVRVVDPAYKTLAELQQPGVYHISQLSNYSDRPVYEDSTSATGPATLLVKRNPALTTTYDFMQMIEITVDTVIHVFIRRVVVASGTTTAGGWVRDINSGGGTFTGAVTFNATTQIKGAIQAYGDGEAALSLIGQTHNYISFYPQGNSAGRQAYIGFPSSGSKEFNINATDGLRFSDKNGALNLGQLIALYTARTTNNRAIELGTEVSGSGPAFIDFHTNTTPGRTDLDARIIASAVDSPNSQQAILTLAAKDVQIQTLTEIFSLSDLKQSGVDTKKRLVDALNAKRLVSTTSETFPTLIGRITAASTARDISINGDAYTMLNYDGDFGTYTDPSGNGWRHSYASIFLYNVGNLIQFMPNLQYNSSAQFYLAAGGRGQITLRDDGERAIDIFPMYTWQPTNAGSGNRILLQLYSFTLDKTQRVLTVIRDFANPSDGVASQPRQKFYIPVPTDFNLNGALRLRLNVGLPNGGYAANGQIAGRLYY